MMLQGQSAVTKEVNGICRAAAIMLRSLRAGARYFKALDQTKIAA